MIPGKENPNERNFCPLAVRAMAGGGRRAGADQHCAAAPEADPQADLSGGRCAADRGRHLYGRD